MILGVSILFADLLDYLVVCFSISCLDFGFVRCKLVASLLVHACM